MLNGATGKDGKLQLSSNRIPLHSTGQRPKDLFLPQCVIGDWRASTSNPDRNFITSSK